MIRRIVYILLALLFGLFAYFQYNDPDSGIWIAFYAGLSALFVMGAVGRYLRVLIFGFMGIIGVSLIRFAPGLFQFLTNQDGIGFAQGMSNDHLYIEEAREFGGLFICLLALLYLFAGMRKQENPT